MPAPVADAPKCDVLGCGQLATRCTDGTEKDSHAAPGEGPRPALPRLNVCDHHENWPHSSDALAFTTSGSTAAVYAARKAG